MSTTSAASVAAAYKSILRVAPPGGSSGAYATSVALEINSGQLTFGNFESSLISLDQTLYTTLPALVVIDALYGATPSQATLTSVATGTAPYDGAYLHSLGYSDANVWTIMAADFATDPTSAFYALYNGLATGTTQGYTQFIDAVYVREFGFLPSAANLQNLLNDIPGLAALLSGGGHTATPLQIMGGLYGYLLYSGQSNGVGVYSGPAAAFLATAATDEATTPGSSAPLYGPELLSNPNLAPAGTTAIAFLTPPTITPMGDHITATTSVYGDLTPYLDNGVGPTLNSNDSVSHVTNFILTDDYGQGVDIIPPGAQLSFITNVSLLTAGNAGESGTPFDTTVITGAPGVQTLTITSSGGFTDYVNAAQTTNITETQNSHGTFAGAQVSGGDNVAIVSNGAGGVIVGTQGALGLPVSAADLPAGTIMLTDNGVGGNDIDYDNDPSASNDGNINVMGGTSVTVAVTSPSNSGNIDIGNTFDNTGNFVGALATLTNPSGPILVMDAAQYGGDISEANNATITVYGGTTVTVTAAGEEVVVGDPLVYNPSNQPTGNVTVTNTGLQIWSDTNVNAGIAQEEDTYVSGGVNVTVTTNTGDVFVGDYNASFEATAAAGLNVAGTAPLAGTQPTGPVIITDTATDSQTSIGVYGGTSVTINGPHTVSAADIQVGVIDYAVPTGQDPVVVASTGNVTIYDNAATAWAGNYNYVTETAVGDAGFGHEIDVIGGANVSVTTNTAEVSIGGAALNAAGTAVLAGENPTGTVTVVNTATAEDYDAGETELNGEGIDDSGVAVYGGTNVTVTASGMDVVIGDDTRAGFVVAPSGTVTVTNMVAETLPYDGGYLVADTDEYVDILGGTVINVMTNAGDVDIGEDGASPTPGSEPTGTITVVNQSAGSVDVYGGTNVTATSWGGYIQIGDGANPANSALTNPTGTVNATMTAVETGWLFDTSVKVEGGTAVTVNTTGGNVYVGTDWQGFGATPVTGAVVVNNTYGGTTQDNIDVMGGTTVTISESVSRDNHIAVGNETINQNPAGTALLLTGDGSVADDPTANVTITDATVNGSTTAYGKENFSVVTNGATTVSVTGGAGHDNYIADVQSTLLSGTGLAAGTSTLTTVSLTGVNGITSIQSDALANLTLDNSKWVVADVYNDTANSALTVNLANDANAHIYDEEGQIGFAGAAPYIGSLVVNTTGTSPSVVSIFAPLATSVTFNDTANLTLGDSWPGTDLDAVKTITVTGAGNLDLGGWSGVTTLTSITATTAAGSTVPESGNIQVEINPHNTSFTGGSGNNVVVILQNAFGTGVTLNGGTGSNNAIYVEYNAAPTDLALGNIGFGVFQHFSDFGVVDGTSSTAATYNVEGFGELIVGGLNVPGQGSGFVGPGSNVYFSNVAGGAALDLVDTDGDTVYYELQTAATKGSVGITVGLDGATSATGTGSLTDTVDLTSGSSFSANSGITSVTVNSQGYHGNTNTLTLQSDPDGGTLALTSITITGDQSLTLNANGAGEAVTSINASGSSGSLVDVMGVTISSKGVTVTGGGGVIEAQGFDASATSAVDTFNIGTGGGYITLGAGGAGYAAGTGTATGSETVNLTATAPVGTTVVAPSGVVLGDGSFGAVNNWTQGVAGSHQTGDSIVLAGAPVVIANATSVQKTFGIYNVSNGAISLAPSSPTVSGAQELLDAQGIVDAGAVGSIGVVTVALVSGTATFVIENNGGGAEDTFVELTGFGPVTGFGAIADFANPADKTNIGAGASVSLGIAATAAELNAVFANVALNNAGSATKNMSFSDAGHTIDTLTASGAGFTNTYTSLGNFGVLEANTIGGGNVVVTQVGVDPVLLFLATGDVAINNLTYGNSAVTGDNPYLVLDAASGSIDINGTLIDSSNTGTTLLIEGSNEVTVAGITDTALASVSASSLTAALTLTANQAHVNIVGSLDGDTITANGAGATVSVGSDSHLAVDSVTITANGAGDTITVIGGGDDVHIGAAGSGDTITVAGQDVGTAYITGNGQSFSSDLSTQLGANDTINVGDTANGTDAHMWLGANSTVNMAASSSADIHLLGDTAGTALTNMTVINGLANHDTSIYLHFNDFTAAGASTGITEAWAGGSAASSQVNEASATSLANALNIAASQALAYDQILGSGSNTTIVGQNTTTAAFQLDAHHALIDWFQYGGNTYLLEAVNSTSSAATHTALASNDIVVELTGLVNADHVHIAGLAMV